MEGAQEESEPPSRTGKDYLSFQRDLDLGGPFFVLPDCGREEKILSLGLQIEVVNDIVECQRLWEEFSPKDTLFECWEFRLAFYNAYKFEPYFILLKNPSENLALLPLEYNKKDGCYTWFGSSWQEENKIFAKDASFASLLLEAAPRPLSLEAMDASCQELLKGEIILESDLPKYVLDLERMKSSEDFLAGLSKNKRHGLRKDRRRIEKQNPQITIDEFSDLGTLISLSKKRFHQKGEGTDWEDSRRIETFRQVIGLRDKSYKVRMISIYIDGQPAGIDLNAIFKGSYYALKCGYDVQSFPGIGNFMNLFEIEDAISLGMKRFDLLQNNYEWKDRLFQQVPLYKYTAGTLQGLERKDLRVRQFEDNDLSRVMEIENSCFLPCDAYPRERIEQLARDHKDDFLVAEREGNIFGYIIAYNNQGIADVDSLAVDPRHRSQGIGKILLSFVMGRFKRQGLKLASLEVRVRNSPAVALFEGLGFRTKRILKGYYGDLGDAYQMHREL